MFASAQKAGELPLRSDRMLTRQIKPAALAAQIGSGIGWPTLRHTYSLLFRQLGVDVNVQQELLRHADAGTTMNLYTQAVSEQKRADAFQRGGACASSSRNGDGRPTGHFWTRTES